MKVEIVSPSHYYHPELPKKKQCDVGCIHVRITNVKRTVKRFQRSIINTTWISKLKGLEKLALEVNAERTIEKIIDEVIKKSGGSVTIDLGEYLVSFAAQEALKTKFLHEAIPLAELLKEKISGNPGFDFHTICGDKYLIFGESKFSLKSTPRAKALRQITEFIGVKDHSELLWLKPFLSKETIRHTEAGRKGYAAAFSLNASNLGSIIKTALKSAHGQTILKHKKFYLIAVEICS